MRTAEFLCEKEFDIWAALTLAGNIVHYEA